MITLEPRYFIYTGYITRLPKAGIVCAVCHKKAGTHKGRPDVRGWVAFHVNHHTRERYCVECSRKIWPFAYPAALERGEDT